MGRLFWKFLVTFWLALVAMGLTITVGVWLLRWFHSTPEPHFENGRLHFMVQSVGSLLAQNDTQAARTLLESWQRQGAKPTLYVNDASGHELLGRVVPPAALAAVTRAVDHGDMRMGERIARPDGMSYLVFALQADEPHGPHRPDPHSPPPFFVPIIAMILASLLFSALLAWYFSKPIRSLRWAFRSATEGKLDTRVQPLMGRRRDEIADLGHDFDQMVQRLQQLIGAQQRLLHDVSHELRSPLARLEAAIGLARQRPDRLDNSLDRIERESSRLNVLVGELLTLARLEAGSEQVKRAQVDLVELITSIADDAQFEARTMQRDVHLEAEGEFVAEVGAELLYRAFENVIRNAVKFTREGSTVEIKVEPQAEQLVMTVSDRGPGVPDNARDAIFEPFHRVEGTSEAGFGLGLAIARRAIESHGGTITSAPREGGGLVMAVTLPRRVPPQAGQQG